MSGRFRKDQILDFNEIARSSVSIDTVLTANTISGSVYPDQTIYVKETKTFYSYILSGSSYVIDNKYVLATADGGNTRWVSFAGKYINNITSEQIQRPNGFNRFLDPNSLPVISWSDPTRTITLTPNVIPGYSYYFNKGKYKEFTVAKTLQISNVTGRHFIYLDDNDTLQEIVNPTDIYIEENIGKHVYISLVYWNAVQQKALDVGDEIHGMMPLDSHLYAHLRDGTLYVSGLAISVTADQDGSLNSHAQITSYSNGRIQDKDVDIEIIGGSPQQLTGPAMLPVVYRLGPTATQAWFIKDADGYPFIYSGDATGFTSVDGRPAYNWFNNTGLNHVEAGVIGWDGISGTVISGTIPNGTWGLRSVTPNHIVLAHTIATHDTRHPIMSICGEASYSTEIEGRYGAITEVKQFSVLGYEFDESVFLHTLIIKHDTAYINTPSCVIISNDNGESSTDWRGVDAKKESDKVTDFALDRIVNLGDGVIKGSTLYSPTYNGVSSFITTLNTWDIQLGDVRRGLRKGSVANLIHGTDTVPVMNYVYIKNDPADNQLKFYVTTTDPVINETALFANFCKLQLWSAARTATDGPASFHEILDKLSGGTDHQSHIRHMNYILRESARWKEGVAPTVTVIVNAGLDDVYFSNTAGVVRQLHLHTFPAKNQQTGSKIYVVNDPVTPYTVLTNLKNLTWDASGNSISSANNKITVVIWGMVDEDGGFSKLFLNLPSSIYTNTYSDLDAANDIAQYANYTIPVNFQGTGFLIGRLTLKYSVTNGGTWTVLKYKGVSDFEDLRATSVSGGGSSFINPDASSVPTNTSLWTGAGYLDTLDTNVQNALNSIDSYEAIRRSASQEPTGYANKTDSLITWNHATRTLSIQPAVTQYDYWIKGKNYIETTLKSKQISTVNGLHFLYFNETQTIIDDEFPPTDQLLKGVAFTVNTYWNNTQGISPHVGEERHGMVMPWADHDYLHFTFGARYVSGLLLNNFTIGDGSLDSHSQLDCSNGVIKDEDIEHNIVNNTPQQMTPILRTPVFYRVGADLWYRTEADNFPIIYSGKQGYVGGVVTTIYTGANLRPAYNQFTGGLWQLTEVGQGGFYLIHFFATNDIYFPIIVILGINTYAREKDAQDAAYSEIQQLTGLPFVEFTPIGTVICEGNNTFANSVNNRFIPTDLGANYIDFRDTRTFKGLSAVLPTLRSGDYTPTITNILNVTGSTIHPLYFFGVSTELDVRGEISIQTTAAGSTQFRLNLPITSLIPNSYILSGSGSETTGAFPLSIRGDTVNNQALFEFTAPAASTYVLHFKFGYRIS